MLAFQEFQLDFGRHLRDPRAAARPAGVPRRRMAIYHELLFNNLTGFLDACYPVTRSVLGEARWRRLDRAFFREARCRTPYFREIPREFLEWLAASEIKLPPWLRELAHYEWVELALDVMEAHAPDHDPAGDLLAGVPVPAPALLNLAYAWPVHRIGPTWRPRKPRLTHLLVYRDADDAVRFIELNPVAARLVALLQEGARTGRDACLDVAREIGHADAEAILWHGAVLLEELRTAGAMLGSRR
ncbi:MAG: putative DNA-binding domain-containing protein [Pseudomonadota bacterium]